MDVRVYAKLSQSYLLKMAAIGVLLLTLLALGWGVWPLKSNGAPSPRLSVEQQRAMIALAAQEFAQNQDPAAVGKVLAGTWSPQDLASLLAVMEAEAASPELRQRLNSLRDSLYLPPVQLPVARERLPLLASLLAQKPIVWSTALSQMVLLAALLVGLSPLAWWVRLANGGRKEVRAHQFQQGTHPKLPQAGERADVSAAANASPQSQSAQRQATGQPTQPQQAGQQVQPQQVGSVPPLLQPGQQVQPQQVGSVPPLLQPGQQVQPQRAGSVPPLLQPQDLQSEADPIDLEDLTAVNDILASAFAETEIVDPYLQAISESLGEVNILALVTECRGTLVDLESLQGAHEGVAA